MTAWVGSSGGQRHQLLSKAHLTSISLQLIVFHVLFSHLLSTVSKKQKILYKTWCFCTFEHVVLIGMSLCRNLHSSADFTLNCITCYGCGAMEELMCHLLPNTYALLLANLSLQDLVWLAQVSVCSVVQVRLDKCWSVTYSMRSNGKRLDVFVPAEGESLSSWFIWMLTVAAGRLLSLSQ